MQFCIITKKPLCIKVNLKPIQPKDKIFDKHWWHVMYRETWKLYWVVIYRRDKISEKIMNKSLVYQYMTINCRVFHLIRVGCIFCQYFNNKSPIFGRKIVLHYEHDLTAQITLALIWCPRSRSCATISFLIWSNGWDDNPTTISWSNSQISPRFWSNN